MTLTTYCVTPKCAAIIGTLIPTRSICSARCTRSAVISRRGGAKRARAGVLLRASGGGRKSSFQSASVFSPRARSLRACRSAQGCGLAAELNELLVAQRHLGPIDRDRCRHLSTLVAGFWPNGTSGLTELQVAVRVMALTPLVLMMVIENRTAKTNCA